MAVRRVLPVHKNDLVMVIAGKERGKRGKVLRVILKRSAVVVEKACVDATRSNAASACRGWTTSRLAFQRALRVASLAS